MAQDKGTRKGEEAELEKQSTVAISFGHFCNFINGNCIVCILLISSDVVFVK